MLCYFLFFLFVVNIVVVVVSFLVTIIDDGQMLSTCCVFASVFEKRKGSFEHLKRKKNNILRLTFVSQKTTPTRHSRSEKKIALYTRSLDQLLLFSFIVFSFSSLSSFLSFPSSFHLLLLQRLPLVMWWCTYAFVTLFCCVVLDGDINSVRKRQIIRSKVQIDKTSHLSIVNLRSFISMKT